MTIQVSEPTAKTCTRCGKIFTGKIYLCAECDAEMEKSEGEMDDAPTMGEVVRALRYCADVNSICGDACPAHIDEDGCRTVLMQSSADRLESQEQTIADLRETLRITCENWSESSNEKNVQIAALTARAEQAEKWAAAAITDIERLRLKKFTLCPICEFEDMIGCAHKNHCTGYEQFKWRGLPQDGEGKENG